MSFIYYYPYIKINIYNNFIINIINILTLSTMTSAFLFSDYWCYNDLPLFYWDLENYYCSFVSFWFYKFLSLFWMVLGLLSFELFVSKFSIYDGIITLLLLLLLFYSTYYYVWVNIYYSCENCIFSISISSCSIYSLIYFFF